MFDFSAPVMLQRLMLLIPLWLSLTVHEWAHAFSAYLLGDDTASAMGRMTLNPLAHIDPVGTLLLPLAGVPFGWAKPVPINPLRFNRSVSIQTGMLLTAAAGPLANLILAGAATMIFYVCIHVLQIEFRATGFYLLFYNLIILNVILAVFNLLPIPPLDGSRIMDALVPDWLRPVWDGICRIGPLLLLAVILLPVLFHVSLLEWPIRAVVSVLHQIIGF